MKPIQSNQDLTSTIDTVIALMKADMAGLSVSPADIDTAEQLVALIDDYTGGKGWQMVYEKMEDEPVNLDDDDADLDDDFADWSLLSDATDYIISDDEYDMLDLDDDDDLDDDPYLSDEFIDLEW